jgi:hypothetical protein
MCPFIPDLVGFTWGSQEQGWCEHSCSLFYAELVIVVFIIIDVWFRFRLRVNE